MGRGDGRRKPTRVAGFEDAAVAVANVEGVAGLGLDADEVVGVRVEALEEELAVVAAEEDGVEDGARARQLPRAAHGCRQLDGRLKQPSPLRLSHKVSIRGLRTL